jgi:outer membrane immunogenic protein
MAADLSPAPTRVYVSPPIWNGGYFGVQAGYAWASTPLTITGLAPLATAFDEIDPKGLTYGVHAGYDLQFGALVLGAVADAELTSIEKRPNGATVAGVFVPGPGKVDVGWQASVRGRIGFALVPSLLLYATGGAAFSNLDVLTAYPAPASSSQTMTGWTAGAGLAYAITRGIAASVEYRYTGFGRFERPMAPPFVARTDMDSQSVRALLSFRFGG